MNKPVAIPFAWYCAWLGDNDEPVWEQYEECDPATKKWDNFPDKIIPLYTHPVKELKLTDQEIIDIAFEYDGISDLVRFARIILRKAQEK